MADDTLVREQLTMLMTLRMHARDAASRRPILGDAHAADVLARCGRPTRRRLALDDNAYAVCARARLIDGVVRGFLDEHADAVVLHLGCGLDSRVLRVDPGPRVSWYDVDQAPVIALRRQAYDERPGTTLVAARVEDPSWWEQVPADRPRLVVAEGLLMYLSPAAVHAVVSLATTGLGPRELVADTVAPWVAAAAGVHPVMRRAGTGFSSTTRDLTRATGGLGLVRRTHSSVVAEAARRTAGPTSLLLHLIGSVPLVGSGSMVVDDYVTTDAR